MAAVFASHNIVSPLNCYELSVLVNCFWFSHIEQ
jgi:hypothetical protein